MIETKDIPLQRETVLHTGSDLPALGPVLLTLPSGQALCHDSVSCTMITIIRPSTGEKAVVVVSASDFDGRRLGVLAQFTPSEARSFAASMLVSADKCDGGMKGAH